MTSSTTRPAGKGPISTDVQPAIAVRAVLRSATHSGTNRRRAREIAWGWVAAKWPRLMPPAAAREQQQLEWGSPGLKLSVATAPDGASWMLEVAQEERGTHRCWTTRAVVTDAGDADVVAVQTTCSDLETAPVVAPPRLLGDLVEGLQFTDAGVAVMGEPSPVDVDQLEAFTRHLVSPERRLPIVVLTNKPGSRYYGADPRGLAEAARGLAHVVCLTPEAAAALTESYGRRLGPVAGAARFYLPGFQEADAAREHPLIHPPEKQLPDGTAVEGHATAFRRSLCRRLCAISARTQAEELQLG